MAGRKAILFEGVDAFCDFIRSHGSAARSKNGYTLYRIQPAEDVGGDRNPSRNWLVLFGYHPRRKFFQRQTYHRIDAEVQENRLVFQTKDLGACSLKIRASTQGRTLTEFITLSPWSTPRPDARELVIFWLRDAALLGQLVGDSMALRNDRIRYAAIQDERQNGQLLVRVEQPSVYLLQLCQEEFADSVELFYPGRENLFLPLGFDYPLIDLWEKHRSESDPTDGAWRFFSADGSVRSVAPVRWEDIYDASDFEFDVPLESTWLHDEQADFRIPLTLRSERRNRAVAPEMWMLQEEQRPQLESLLTAVDEADLDNLLLSIQRDATGRQLFFVREKHTSRDRKYFDFTGQRLATYKGYPNLFLPTNCELQPQLRRDQYPALFELKAGELTIMLPENDDVPQDGTKNSNPVHGGRLLRLSERSFNPLRSYIDYLIQGDRELLEEVITKSVFDFAHYANAPKRPDLLQQKTAAAKPKTGDKQVEGKFNKPSKTNAGGRGNSSEKSRRSRGREDDAAWQVIPRNELEKEEQELETQLASDTTTLELWLELCELKTRLAKYGGAAMCGVEALWLSEDEDAAEQLREEWRTLLGKTAARSSGNSSDKATDEKQPAQIAIEILSAADMDRQQLSGWIQQATTDLRSAESQFRVKVRWLLWGELLKRNRDHVEQARVREQVLQQLRVGLSHEEIPDFIRAALMRAGQLDEEEGDDRADAADNLRGLEEQTKRISSPDLRQPTIAMTARAYAKVGLFDRARVLCEQLSDDELEPLSLCLVKLFAREALTSIDEPAAERYGADFARIRRGLARDEAQVIVEIEQSLEDRREADNVAELLSAENYRMFFPSTRSNDLDERLEEQTDLFLDGVSVDFDLVFAIVNSWFAESGLDEQRLALRTRQLVQGLLTRMQWGSDGPRVVAAFEQLMNKAASIQQTTHFYHHLLQVAFAQGLVQLGQESQAAEMLNEPLSLQRLELLDAIDVCSARLTVIESIRLRGRGGLLPQLMASLTTDQVYGVYITHSLRVLDQTIEAAISKEKFAAQKFQQHIDHEEFMIRQRVLSEDFCQTTEPAP